MSNRLYKIKWSHWTTVSKTVNFFRIGCTIIKKLRPELDPKWTRLCEFKHIFWHCIWEREAHQLGKTPSHSNSSQPWMAPFRSFFRTSINADLSSWSGVAVSALMPVWNLVILRLVGGRIIRRVTGWSHFTHYRSVFNCSLQPTGSS